MQKYLVFSVLLVFSSTFSIGTEFQNVGVHIYDILPDEGSTWEFKETPIRSGPAILRPNGVSVFGGNKNAIYKWIINNDTLYGRKVFYYFGANKDYKILVKEYVDGKPGRSWLRDVKVIPEIDCESGGRKFGDAGNSPCITIKEEVNSIISRGVKSTTILTSSLKYLVKNYQSIYMNGVDEVRNWDGMTALVCSDEGKKIKVENGNIIFNPGEHFKKEQKWYMSRYYFILTALVPVIVKDKAKWRKAMPAFSNLFTFAIGSAKFKINTPDVDISLVAKRPIYNQTKQPINGEVFFDQLPGGEYTVTVYKSNRPIVTKTFIMDQIDQAVEMDLSK